MSETLQTLRQQLFCGQSGIAVSSHEPEALLRDLGKMSIDSFQNSDPDKPPVEVMFWDSASGYADYTGNSVELPNSTDSVLQTSQQAVSLLKVLSAYFQLATERNVRVSEDRADDSDNVLKVLCIRNADRYLGDGPNMQPSAVTLLQKIVHYGQATGVYVILQTAPGYSPPSELVEHLEVLEHKIPTDDERSSILSDDIDVSPEHPEFAATLRATAGLSRAKTAQYAAETITRFGDLLPSAIFRRKAEHLSRSAKLDVWSPEFVTERRLWPDIHNGALSKFEEACEVTLVRKETWQQNDALSEGEIRCKLRYVLGGATKQAWLDPMSNEDFESRYRPENNFYTLDSIVGLKGLKKFVQTAFRPGVPERAKLRHLLTVGVPGVGKSMMMRCCSGEFDTPLSTIRTSELFSKWLGETDKQLTKMLSTAEEIGGIVGFDEFQRFMPTGGGAESGGVENRLLGTLLTWFNDQRSNIVLSAANNISHMPDEITRSGRVDALMFVGFPTREAKDAAWAMYLKRHELDPDQSRPKDDFWVPADIMSCCRLAELHECDIKYASRWITPSYTKSQEQMDELMRWAEASGCICAETGDRYTVASGKKKTTPKRREAGARKTRVQAD